MSSCRLRLRWVGRWGRGGEGGGAMPPRRGGSDALVCDDLVIIIIIIIRGSGIPVIDARAGRQAQPQRARKQ